MDFQLASDLFTLVAVPRLMIRSQGFERLSFLATDCMWSEATLSALRVRTVRWISWGVILVRVPLDTKFCEVEGPNVGKVEDPVPRSGSDSAGRDISRSAPLGSWMASASLLTLLRARRFFRGRERKPGAACRRWFGENRESG